MTIPFRISVPFALMALLLGCVEPTANRIIIMEAKLCYEANMRAVLIGPYGVSGNQYRIQCRPHKEQPCNE